MLDKRWSGPHKSSAEVGASSSSLPPPSSSSAAAFLPAPEAAPAQKLYWQQALPEPSLEYHRKLASETHDIEHFQCNTTSGDDNHSAAWIFDAWKVLTLRLGDPNSYCRGWIEVVVRSSSSRSRQLIRLHSKVSLPKFSPSVHKKARNPAVAAVSDRKEDISLPATLRSQSADDSPLLKRAQDLMNQVDAMLARDTSDPKDLLGRWSNHSITSFLSSERDDGEDIIDDSSFQDDTNERVRPFSVRHWLENGLGLDAADCDEICEVLHSSYEFSQDSLGAVQPSHAIDADACEPLQSPDAKMANHLHRLKSSPMVNQAVAILDKKPPCLTYKIGLLYAGSQLLRANNSDTETAILANPSSSSKFHQFASALGPLVVPTNELRYFSGGLDTTEYQSDGAFARIWTSPSSSTKRELNASRDMIVFHDLTWMPSVSLPSSGTSTSSAASKMIVNNRKRHIGNDSVLIVFMDDDDDNDIVFNEHGHSSLISGHFGFVTIYVTPMTTTSNAKSTKPDEMKYRICVRIRHDIINDKPILRDTLMHHFSDTMIASSTQTAASIVRSIAMRSDLACRSLLDTLSMPPSPCFERYRILQQLKKQMMN
mmetsp:Transcript_21353/g.61002  ORF Transcript_21353/g.61002 Transcript_21353/m.61002 type:complete len:597 (+) Transcript_21353:3-1793(+)